MNNAVVELLSFGVKFRGNIKESGFGNKTVAHPLFILAKDSQNMKWLQSKEPPQGGSGKSFVKT